MNDDNLSKHKHVHLKKKRSLDLIFIVGIIIFIGIVSITYTQFKSLLTTNNLVADANNVIQTTNTILHKMTDIELNVKNYLLTSDERFIADLKEKTNDLKTSAQRLASIAEVVDERLAEINNLIQLKMNGTLLSSDIIAETLNDQIISDKLYAEASEIIKIEYVFMHNVSQQSASNTHKILVIIAVGSIASISLLLMYLFLNYRLWKNEKIEVKLDAFDELNKNIQEIQDKSEKTTLLLEMSDVMLACDSIQELSNIISKYAASILSFTSGLFYIMHPSKNYLEANASWGKPKSVEAYFSVERCWSIRLGHIYEASAKDKELVCNHVKKGADDITQNFSYLCIPLRARNDVFGLLYLEVEAQQHGSNKLTPSERLIVNSFTELTALALSNIRLQNSLQYQSIRDHLTSLYNRRYLDEFLSKQLVQSEHTKISIALMIIDVDDFKTINDTYGHEAGDLVLKELAVLFLQEVRPGDLAARYGGDEFIIVLYNVDAQTAKKRAEKLKLDASRIRVKYGAQDILSFTLSIGISLYPQNGHTSMELIDSADRALYFAKNSGKDKAVVLSEIVGSEH